MEDISLARHLAVRTRLTGSFTLRSGAVSAFYWDKYRFESDPTILCSIADALARLLPSEFDRLAGLELGGIPLATALSIRTGKPCLYVRKTAKTHGTCNLVEGGFGVGEVVVVVEDVVTTAGQVVESVRHMRDLGLRVHQVVCVIDLEEGSAENLATTGCSLRSVFTMAQLETLQE